MIRSAALTMVSLFAAAALQSGGAQFDVFLKQGKLDLNDGQLRHWIQRAADSVSAYYGEFPVSKVSVNIKPTAGDDIGFSTADYEDGIATIDLPLGAHTPESLLPDDWVLTHEMVHLAFPLVDDRHRWLAEGQAVYIEPIARMLDGIITPQRVWADLVKNLPQGLPERGDRGLNHTHTWGRTYWGGALFCLMADIKIREATHNRKGLKDAVRAIAKAGGNITSDWEPEEALRVGDQAIGVNVLEKLYADWKDKPVAVDLEKLWRDLGVVRVGDSVRFDDSAPLAEIRKAIAS